MSSLSEPFELLREIGNVFIVKYGTLEDGYANIRLDLTYFDRCCEKVSLRGFSLRCLDPISNNEKTTIQVTCIDW